MVQLGFNWTYLNEILLLNIFRKSVEENHVFKSGKKNWDFTGKPT